jgi:hypothetical protein
MSWPVARRLIERLRNTEVSPLRSSDKVKKVEMTR